MSILLWERLVARHIIFRIVAFLCFAIGVFIVWIQPTQVEQTQSRFLVQLSSDREKELQRMKLPESALKQILQNRDLSKYDFGGVIFDCNSVLDEMQNCETLRNNARSFVSEHWENKKRAYLVVAFSAMDSASNAHIFIEPDKNGKWRVVWKLEDARRDPFRIIRVSVAQSVKSEVYFSPDTGNMYGQLNLSFLDKNGREIETF